MEPFCIDAVVRDFFEILEEHRKNCEKQGKYVEAEIAKNRLEELRAHEENRCREAIRSKQITERIGVEETHIQEFQKFNTLWDEKMEQFEQRVDESIALMLRRHEKELQEFQLRALQQPPRPKYSCELLDLRRIQTHLAKAKEYAEAHRMKLRSDALEAWELDNWCIKRQELLLHQELMFKHKKAAEMRALLKRIQTGRDEERKNRQKDLERLLKRYQNIKMELEVAQNLERIRIERSITVRSAKDGAIK